jgi:hypothetical protein
MVFESRLEEMSSSIHSEGLKATSSQSSRQTSSENESSGILLEGSWVSEPEPQEQGEHNDDEDDFDLPSCTPVLFRQVGYEVVLEF